MVLADEVALMNKGALSQVGTPEQIYNRPANRFAANFLGAVNWLGDFGVRPEAMRVTRDPLPTGERCRSGSVDQVTFLGNHFRVSVRMSTGQAVTAEVDRNEVLVAGEGVRVWWNATDELHLPPEVE